MLTREEIEEKRESKLGDRQQAMKEKDRSKTAREQQSWGHAQHGTNCTGEILDENLRSNKSASVTRVATQPFTYS